MTLYFPLSILYIPVVYTGKTEGDYVIDGSQDNSLQFQNVYGGDNDVSINKLIGVLKKNHELIFLPTPHITQNSSCCPKSFINLIGISFSFCAF